MKVTSYVQLNIGIWNDNGILRDAHRLLLMNLMLHGIEATGVGLGDTLSPDGERLPKADLVLTNPPFGTKKGGGRPMRSDFTITAETSNKQLAFVEHVVRALKPGGRVGMVVPDNVLFVDGTGQELRTWLMDLCNLHTILRLPTGIFYSQGVRYSRFGHARLFVFWAVLTDGRRHHGPRDQ